MNKIPAQAKKANQQGVIGRLHPIIGQNKKTRAGGTKRPACPSRQSCQIANLRQLDYYASCAAAR